MTVLILIVVDKGLVQYEERLYTKSLLGLNPYCSGQRSRTLSIVSSCQ